MTRRHRRLGQFGVLAVVAALASAVVIAAVQADGRTDVRAETNDGGAWLVRRSTGVVGHLNRAAGEVSGIVDVASPGADFDVEEAGTTIAVNDHSTTSVSVIDGRTFQIVNHIAVAPASHLALVDGAAGAGGVVWTADPLQVWWLTAAQLTGQKDLQGVDPVVSADGAGLVTTTSDGSVWVVDSDGRRATLLRSPEAQPAWIDLGETGAKAAASSAVGEAMVLTIADAGGVTIVDPDGTIRQLAGVPAGAALAIPAPAGSPIAAVSPAGDVVRGDIDGGTTSPAVPIGSAGGGAPVQPIAYRGCVFAVVTSPPTFTRTCANGTDQTEPLDGSTGSALRLRLVNGWIWVNDLDSGALWVTSTEGPLDRIDDWGADLNEADKGDDDSNNDGTATEKRDNPDSEDASFEEADQIDDDGINEPPVAHDDQARTRADQAVLVDVLANDDDPDGDVLLVTSVSGQPADARVTPTADRTAVQVEPPPGFTGVIPFTYAISDGRGGTSQANVTVTVNSVDGSDNRPPIPVTDVAEARAGASASLNLLNNDSDPDGDGLILQSVTSETGTVVFDPSGQITFTPDPTSVAGSAEANYVVADTFGATATGTVRVEIRLDGSNNEPDARNDSAVAVVGKPVTLNVLTNDTDPDNDPLTVTGAPAVIIPQGTDITALDVTLSPDGEFFFAPTAAGSYVFRYSVIDGSESDSAIIRVDVDAVTDNRQPIAVRDDATISRGGTKTVYVLQNDADPDGDVIALTGWTGAPGLEIEEVQGVGFRITAAADAAAQLLFHYSISDGRSDPVTGTVVVSVSSLPSVDQAPVARPDVVEVRAGQTTAVQVLVNDYDPEGTPIRVASVASAPSATLRIGPGAQEIYIGVDTDAVTGFSFGYDVVDAGGNRSASFVQVQLVPEGQPNRPPIARPDVARTRSGAAVTIAVLTNDSDPDGDAVRLESIAAQPAFGVATPNADGTITYAADADHSGTDRLKYVVVDAFGDRSIGDVLIGVLPPGTDNLAPTAADDAYTVVAGGDPIALDVLTNDWDGDGDALDITRASGNTPITVDEARRNLVYTPPRTITGDAESHTVVYSISDGHGGTDDANVTIDVVSSLTPAPPVAVDDVVGPVHPGETIAADLLANDIDPDGARAALVGSSTDPAIVFGADGSATVTAGTATSEHTYTVTDATGLTATALVTIIVTDNLGPTAPLIQVETPAGQAVSIDIGAQVTDPDGDQLFFACCDGGRHGTATTTASGAGALTVDFLPDGNFAGEAGFSYTADDQHGHVVSGAVMVKVVAPANTAPTATDATGQVEAGTVGTVALSAFATDPDLTSGDQLSFELIDPPAGMTIAGDTVSLDAPIDAGDTTVSARYRATDRAGASAEAGLAVTITPSVAPPPNAIADAARTTQGIAVSLDVLANDVDPLGRGLQIIDVGSVDGSSNASVGADGRTVTITPQPEFFGTARLVYTVQDARRSQAGQAVGQIMLDVVGLPGAPPTPQATASNATATVTWGQAPANGSPIDDVQLESDNVAVQSVGTVSSFTYSGLTNGLAYRFRVRAHNEAGWGTWSDYSSPVTPDTQAGRPAAPTVAFADGALVVSWTAPPNEGSAISGYTLEIGGGTSNVIQLGNVLQYTWTGLSNGTSYQFRVTAVNGAGPSEPSAFSAPEHPLREPSEPGAPAVTQGDRFLDLSWAKPVDNGDPVIEYQVERSSNPGVYVPAAGTTMRWSDLPNGVEQTFRVRARNRDLDWGAWSALSTPVKPCGVPDAAAAPTATRGDTVANIAWVAPNAQGCDIDQYQVDANAGTSQAATGTTHTFTGLTNGTAYTFRVRAHNSVGWGAWSAPSTAVTPAGVPTGPASISATPAAVGAVDLTWPAAGGNGSALTGYQISVNNGTPRDINVVTSYRYSGLSDGTAYSFTVRACNDVGCGTWSSSDSATTWGVPDQVGAPSVNGGDKTISATWSAPAANGSAINKYRVELDPGSVSDNTDRSKSWTGLQDGTSYRVRVQACNDVGCGAWSGWTSARTDPGVTITLTKGTSAVGEPNCSATACRHLDVTGTGLSANTNYTLTCYGDGSAFSSRTVTTNGSGTFTDSYCYWGYPNTDVYVTVNSYKSNTIHW